MSDENTETYVVTLLVEVDRRERDPYIAAAMDAVQQWNVDSIETEESANRLSNYVKELVALHSELVGEWGQPLTPTEELLLINRLAQAVGVPEPYRFGE